MTTVPTTRLRRVPLLWKLMGIHLLVITTVIGLIWIAMERIAGDYFMRLMKEYHIDPAVPHRMFLHATTSTLIWASLGAVVLALAPSWVLTRRILHPIRRMGAIAGRIASGDYSQRVDAIPGDEVGELVGAFNQMVCSLQRVEKLRKDLVADVAHELRTPLTNMRGYLEALRDGVLPPSPEQIASLHEEVLRLVRLVEGLHQLAIADAGVQRLRFDTLNLSALTMQALAPFRPRFAQKAILLSTSDLSDRISVRVDHDQFVCVLNNLFENAWHYTPGGGAVTVSIGYEGPAAVLSVSNTGEGISSQDLPFIFERFYRGEKSRSREHGGAGIGLSLVKQIVEAHDGAVSVDIRNSLTTFRVTIPLAAQM
ncbi:MAG: HAMP domain-containing protein [Nitrospirae bacterium]|nr:HAMP domain-containing protein [Nitrospirota bacterium]